MRCRTIVLRWTRAACSRCKASIEVFWSSRSPGQLGVLAADPNPLAEFHCSTTCRPSWISRRSASACRHGTCLASAVPRCREGSVVL
jgi:hypothetical protein